MSVTDPPVLAHESLGTGDRVPIVFVGSLGTDREMWRPQLDILSPQHPLVLVDHPGHDGKPIPDHPFSVEDLADAVVVVADGLGLDRFHLAGLSLGGMVGMALAAKYPERIERLAVLCSSAHMPPADAWRDRADLVRREGTEAVVGAVAGRWFTDRFRSAQPSTVRWAEQMLLDVDPVGYARCCEAIADMDLRPELGRITAPTLVIGGVDDPATPPPHAETIAAGIADSTLELLERAAHLANVEQPRAVGDLLLHHFRPETDEEDPT